MASVAILTPLYNGWEFLEQAALSVFLQRLSYEGFSYTWEWWIGVNGHGPTGGPALTAAKKIEQLAAIYNLEMQGCQVRVVNLPDAHGKCAALNALAGRVEPAIPWIAILDADDTWEREKLLLQLLAVREGGPAEGAGVVGTYTYYFGDVISRGPVLPSGWIAPEYLLTGNPIINSSALIARRWVGHWKDWVGRGLEDYALWMLIVASGGRLFNLADRVVHHRIHAASAFNGKGGQGDAEIRQLRALYLAALKGGTEVFQGGQDVGTSRCNGLLPGSE